MSGATHPGLIAHHVRFVAALRRAGLAVSAAESLDAARAWAAVGLGDRQVLRSAYAACLCKRAEHRRSFDTLFDLYYPPRLGDGVAGRDRDDEDPAALRDALREALLDGDPEALELLAGQAVSALGRTETAPGRQAFFAYRVLRALSPDTLVAALLAALLGDQPRGGLAERVARESITERLRTFEQAVEAEVRRRLAEERGADHVARTTASPLIDQVDFLRASRAELAELRREVYPLARRLATRLTARRRLGRDGRLDFRRTVRASLATGGVPLVTHYLPHRPHKPELVVLCDVSGSVATFAHFTLMLVAALREQFTKVRAFAFIDTCDEVTGFFHPGVDLAGAMARVVREAELVWFDGHSDYGHSFERFAERYPDAIGPRTSLLVLGDARTNYRAPRTATLAHLAAKARHSYWLNPEPIGYWGSGDSATAMYAEVIDEMVECRNVAQLSDFVARLLPG